LQPGYINQSYLGDERQYSRDWLFTVVANNSISGLLSNHLIDFLFDILETCYQQTVYSPV